MEGVAVGVHVGGPPILLLQIEVTQADRQARVVSLASQGGGAHCGEGAWAQAVRRNNLTFWSGRSIDEEKGVRKILKNSFVQGFLIIWIAL